MALLHHLPCGDCERCRAGHESTCEAFAAPTIVPGGFAEEVGAERRRRAADEIDDATGTYVEPLACVLRGAERVPRGRVLVVGHGFVGRLFSEVLRRRGDEVFATDANPERSGRAPDGPVDAAVLCAPAAPLDAVAPGGTVLVFAGAAGRPRRGLPPRADAVGSRSATPRTWPRRRRPRRSSTLPEPTVLPLDRFAEGLDLYRSGARLKVVFTP